MTGDGPYSDAFWLKITDMLIYSIYCLFGVAAVGTILNLERYLQEIINIDINNKKTK